VDSLHAKRVPPAGKRDKEVILRITEMLEEIRSFSAQSTEKIYSSELAEALLHTDCNAN